MAAPVSAIATTVHRVFVCIGGLLVDGRRFSRIPAQTGASGHRGRSCQDSGRAARSAPLTASRCGAFYAASSTTAQISTTGENRPTTTAKYAGGTCISGSYGDIDALFREQAIELDRRKREAGLQRIQQLIHEKAAVAPIQEVASLTGVGPHVEQSALGLIAGYAFFSAPYFPQPAGKDERAERRGDPPVQEVGSGFPLLL